MSNNIVDVASFPCSMYQTNGESETIWLEQTMVTMWVDSSKFFSSSNNLQTSGLLLLMDQTRSLNGDHMYPVFLACRSVFVRHHHIVCVYKTCRNLSASCAKMIIWKWMSHAIVYTERETYCLRSCARRFIFVSGFDTQSWFNVSWIFKFVNFGYSLTYYEDLKNYLKK